ncbi:MAG: hypothetical protein M3Q51_03410 [Pseudomonadota bacterium]|nr:hypothetical protein [Pseudomonadota bacterium]MDQ3160054.1 hypothetical protein [Pseudomonadota bacterium]
MNEHVMRQPSINTKAVIWSALIAGAVFMMLEMVMVPLFLGGSPWGPPRMIAAIAMGKSVLPPPATFDITILMVAMAIHFSLSLVLAFVFAFIAKGRSIGSAALIGGIFGLVVYLVHFYGMTAVFPWFEMARNWVSVFAHVVFGVVLGWVYASIAGRTAMR